MAEAVVTALIPLPTFYNPDESGERQPVEDEKFTQSADELAMLTEEGGTIHGPYRDGNVRGVWWDKGFLDRDTHAVIEIDFRDSPAMREALEDHIRSVLVPRFRQKAIYVKYVFPVERSLITEKKIEVD
jgi:hypothetical protein